MKQTPIHIIVARLNRIALPHQIAFLQSLLKQEKPHSVRRNELQSLLDGKMLKQLKKENRAA